MTFLNRSIKQNKPIEKFIEKNYSADFCYVTHSGRCSFSSALMFLNDFNHWIINNIVFDLTLLLVQNQFYPGLRLYQLGRLLDLKQSYIKHPF